jgi:hypothetical protein
MQTLPDELVTEVIVRCPDKATWKIMQVLSKKMRQLCKPHGKKWDWDWNLLRCNPSVIPELVPTNPDENWNWAMLA